MQTQSQLTIRPVTITDAAQLQANCFSAVSVEQVQGAIHATLAATADGKEYQLVAEVDGVVIGVATLIREGHRLRAHRAGVFGLVVHPDYQGRGIARQLVDALAAQAQTLGIEILEVSCRGGTGAEQVYGRLGFIEYGRLPQGLLETGEQPVRFDEVYFYRPVKTALGKGPFMKKASKQKKNKQQEQALHLKQQQSKSQSQDVVTAATEREPQRLTTDGIDVAPPSPSMPVEQAPGEAEAAPSPQQNAPLTLAEVLKQKAALLAQNQQRTQWNQQRKAGKMMNAHVPKRFNRGG